MSKYLLRGFGLVGLSSSLMFYREGNQLPSLEEEVINNFVDGEEEQDELIKKAGLECGKKYCLPNSKENRKFNVEKNKKDENLFFDSWTKGRLRVHRGSEGYPSGLRFTIEGSDIPLYSRKFWISNLTSNLEEFENYEIKKEGGKYYLSRTKNSREGMIVELGLPDSCVLPEEGESTCSIFHVEKVKFGEGMVGEVDSEVSLTITKTEDTSFRDGFKFTFTFPQDVTIGGKEVKAKSPVDFRMKKHKDGHLTLEWAWVDEKELLDKVRLVCGEDSVCSIKSGGTLKIKKGEKQDFLDFSDLVGGRIKLYRNDEEYSNGLRLEVEGGNIVSEGNTLEEFETYEIKEEENEYYLLLKKNSEERIEELLKYPCSLSSTCSISSERKLKSIKFEGKDESTISLPEGKTVKITVSKTPEENYPVGRKFTFTFPKDVTIGGKVVKANSPTDFKLKRHEDGNLTLERAWANENDLAGKVGLDCGEEGNCSLKSGETLSIKNGDKNFKISSLTQETGGKIKLHKDAEGYSNGLKFAIEGGKIVSGDDVLEEFETYEIKVNGSEYYLELKTNAEKRIKELLNFPSRCSDSSSSCEGLTEAEIKNINFEDKNVSSISLKAGQTVKITVSNAPESDFPFSRKFTVTSSLDLNISSSNTVKANSPTDYKLKNNNGSLSLEKAWSNVNELVGKVGLNCEGSDNCTIKNGSIKVRKENQELHISTLSEGKIKLYKNSAGYSNGLKFTIEDKNIGTGEQILEEFETYEIAEDKGGYYLNLKTNAEKRIKELLKFPDRCSSKSTCDNLNENEFKKISFSGKENSSFTKNAKVKITVSKASEEDFPLGRKFSVESSLDLKISDSTSLKTNVPTEFKIKREKNGQSTNLYLEKAWDLASLTRKVGLSCTDDNCTITKDSLNVKIGSKLLKGASKKDPQNTGKIKLLQGQPGYNDGFKFQIQDANIDLSSSSGQTGTLEEFETYEINKVGVDYYLIRKTEALQGKWEALGLPEKCRFNFGKNSGCSIGLADLKNIKFLGKNPNGTITIGNAGIWLKTFSDSNLPLGIMVKMEVKRGNVKIPKTSGGTIVLWSEYETEFKVKKESDDYSLVRTVDVNEEVKKIGITNGNCDDETGCTIGSTINIYMSGTQYRRNAGVSDKNKKITYRWGDMKSKSFSNNLVFRVPNGGIKLTSSTGDATRSIGFFSSIEAGTYVIKTSTVGADNGKGTVTYLYKEKPQSYDPGDSFFNY